MNRNFRSLIKRKLPRVAKRAVLGLRKATESPPIDDIVLAQYRMVAEENATPRLNLVIPNLSASTAFGGIATGLEILLLLLAKLREAGRFDLRVIFTEPDRETDISLLAKTAQARAVDTSDTDFMEITNPKQVVPMRRNDLFFTYNWWTTRNARQLRDAQAAHFGIAPRPLIYLVQEYEPQIFPLSSAHMLAREALEGERLWRVINSGNLADYLHLQGHRAERNFTFEPVINASLRPFLDRVTTADRDNRILVYGRPGIARNAFPALLRGLRYWARENPDAADWEVVSAGTPHPPIALGNGRTMQSVGKLSLSDYAELLLSSRVGLSLMASPHPSYPPLEMAHFGLRTITNAYSCKQWADAHPNLRIAPSLDERPLAADIAAACAAAFEPVDGTRDSGFTRAEAYPFLAELARGLCTVLER